MSRIINFFKIVAITLIPTSAFAESHLSFSIEEPTEGHDFEDFSNLPLLFGELSQGQPSLRFTQREPVYAFLQASDGARYHDFSVCSRDGGQFSFTLSLTAEISSINHQLDQLGPDGYDTRVAEIAAMAIHTFQTAARAEEPISRCIMTQFLCG